MYIACTMVLWIFLIYPHCWFFLGMAIKERLNFDRSIKRIAVDPSDGFLVALALDESGALDVGKIPVVNDILDRLKLRFLESEFLIGDVNNLWKTRIVIIFGTKVKR